MKRAKTWTCRRQTGGVVCLTTNPSRARKCMECGKSRPARKQPAHMSALLVPYEEYVRINGSETCGICGRAPSPNRKLDRDHEHKGDGKPRGLLCVFCNKTLKHSLRPEWLRAAADYLERTA